jgi:hypothetical protein
MLIFSLFRNNFFGMIKKQPLFLRVMETQAIAKRLLTLKNRWWMGYELESKKRTRRVFRIITVPIFNSLNRTVSQGASVN